ncbi:hypothetical protein Tco_0481682 [Tanacetum coccineum]
MSSPDHPTANLEDVFSSNFPNYVPPASPDYVPASPGKTYSSASNLFGIVLLASPTLSLFPMSTIDATWEQILDILNSLDAIPIERIEHIENGIEGLEKGNNASKKLKLRPMAFSASQYRQETPGPTGTPAVKMGNYKEFISCNITTFNAIKVLRATTFWNKMMSSPNRSTSDIEDAFSSMNILNYTSVSSDYFPASSGSNSFNSSDNMIPPVFSPFYNNTYLKDVQAIYAKESPISSPAILTLFPVLPPSLLFNPRYFFIPEELLLPRKQIHSPSSSSTTLFNSSRNQTCNLVSPSSSVYTSTPPQVFEIGKCSDKMYLEHHKKQVKDILNYLYELYLHRIERMEEGRINGNELKTELKKIRTQIIIVSVKRSR